MYFTIYKVTIKDIGTKFVNRRIQLPHLMKSVFERENSSAYSIDMFGVVKVEIRALVKVNIIWAINMPITIKPILNYSLDFFCLDLLLFSMILESTPVYKTKPVTQLVIFKLHPLRIMLLLSIGMLL
jgi:hypothetical protein